MRRFGRRKVGFELNYGRPPLAVQFGSSGTTVTIEPRFSLDPNTRYRLDYRVKDLAGNSLFAQFPFLDFTTGP